MDSLTDHFWSVLKGAAIAAAGAFLAYLSANLALPDPELPVIVLQSSASDQATSLIRSTQQYAYVSGAVATAVLGVLVNLARKFGPILLAAILEAFRED